MIIEKNRYVNELQLLFNSTSEITAETLATYTDSSVRTVKNDIKYLNEELKKADGCQIYSHKGKGYSILVFDEEKAEALKHKIDVLNSLFGDRSIIDTSRWLFLVQKLLTHPEKKKNNFAKNCI